MSKERKIIIALVVLLLVTAISIFSMGGGSHQEMKKITEKLALRADSLAMLQKGYDSIRIRYDSIYTKLDVTRKQLYNYQASVDSIMGSNISSVADLKSSLKDVIDKQPEFTRINPEDNADLF